MKFEQWMETEGHSESLIKRYMDAIDGPLSLWADLQNFTFGSLTSIVDLDVFDALAEKIESTEDFQIRNKRVHDMYRDALNKYREFLSSRNHPYNEIE